MPATYCFNCSEKIIYEVFKPKECPHCKQSPHASISLAKDKPSLKIRQPQKRSVEDTYDEYEDEYTNVPRLKSLKARIYIDPDQNKQTIGNVIESEKSKISSQSAGKKGRGRPKKIVPPKKAQRPSANSQSFEDFMRSDGSNTNKPISID